MSGFYKNAADRNRDVVIANCAANFSINARGELVPPTALERNVFAIYRAAAITRLVIDKLMQAD